MTASFLLPTSFMPYPEIVAGEPAPYEIIDTNEIRGLPTNGMADLMNRVLYVPFDAAGRVVSRHELAHVLWSKPRARRARGFAGYFQATEDGRINRGLALIALPLQLSEAQVAEVVSLGVDDLAHGEAGIIPWALRTVASFGTNVAEPLLALADAGDADPRLARAQARAREIVRGVQGKLETARRKRGGPVCSFEDGSRISRWLAGELRKLGLTEPKHARDGICCFGEGLPLGDDDSHGGRRTRSRLAGAGHGRGGVRSGRMTIATPALPHRCAPTPYRRLRGRRASAEGTQLRDVSRFAHDKRVFVGPRRREGGGGSVLIDTSGSMSLSARDIDRLIAAAPEATLVALYSGREGEGELRIVVRNGRRAEPKALEPYGGANVVDLPALEWLARQPRPRVWVSDGHVTGCNDRPSRSLLRRCRSVCARARIVRVPDTKQAVKRLAAER